MNKKPYITHWSETKGKRHYHCAKCGAYYGNKGVAIACYASHKSKPVEV